MVHRERGIHMNCAVFRAIVDDMTGAELGFTLRDIRYIRVRANVIIVRISDGITTGDSPNACVYDKNGNWLDWLWLDDVLPVQKHHII